VSRSELVPVDSESCGEDFGDYGGDMLYEEEGPPLYDTIDQVITIREPLTIIMSTGTGLFKFRVCCLQWSRIVRLLLYR
jgi:hypothetical protein